MSLPVDIHTHRADFHLGAIVSVQPREFAPQEGWFYSVGIHPWSVAEVDNPDRLLLAEALRHPQVVAIGETGIDRLHGGTIELQTELFKAHIELAEALHKPLIIHAVRSFDLLLALRKAYRPQQRWVIHGFRNNAATARLLLQAGCDLSFGEHFNPEAVAATPIERLWIESDESMLPIETIARNIALVRGCDADALLHDIALRVQQTFFTP